MMKSAAKDVANRDDDPEEQEKACAEHVRVFKQTCKKLWAKLHVANKDKARLERELKKSKQNESRLEQLLQSANAKNRLIGDELDSLKHELESTKNAVQSTKGELQSMKNELESMENELQSTKGELQSMKNEHELTKSEPQSTEGQFKSMKQSEVGLRQQVKQLQQQHTDHTLRNQPEVLLKLSKPIRITDQHDNNERSSSFVTLTSANVTRISTRHSLLYVFELYSCQNLVEGDYSPEACIRPESTIDRYTSVLGFFVATKAQSQRVPLPMLIFKIGHSELDRQFKRKPDDFLTLVLNHIISLIECYIDFNMDQLTEYSNPILQHCNAQESFANRRQLQRVPAPFRNMDLIAIERTWNCIITLLMSSLLQNADKSIVDQHSEGFKPQQHYLTSLESLITECNSQLATSSMANADLSVPTMTNCTHLHHLNSFRPFVIVRFAGNSESSVGQHLEVLKLQQHYRISQEFFTSECHLQLTILSMANVDGMLSDLFLSMPTMVNCSIVQLKDLDSFQEELDESSVDHHLEDLKPQHQYRTSQAFIAECNSQLAKLSMANADGMPDDLFVSMPTMTNGAIIQPKDLGSFQEK